MPVAAPEGVVAVGFPLGLDVLDRLRSRDDGFIVVQVDERVAVVAHAELLHIAQLPQAVAAFNTLDERLVPTHIREF